MLNSLFKAKKPLYGFDQFDKVEKYYWNGFYQGKFDQTEKLTKLVELLGDIRNNNLKDGFELISKYDTTKDLRPNVYSYDEVFVSILIENNIPALLAEATGQELVLNHIQLRIAYPSQKGYMEWHRDTHHYSGEDRVAGNVPPVHKLIFYPTFEESEETIHFLPGSNLRFSPDQTEDMEQVSKFKKDIVTLSSNNQLFTLFNTFTLHSTKPTHQVNGAMRLIYSFSTKSQLEKYKDQAPLHKMYLDMSKHD